MNPAYRFHEIKFIRPIEAKIAHLSAGQAGISSGRDMEGSFGFTVRVGGPGQLFRNRGSFNYGDGGNGG